MKTIVIGDIHGRPIWKNIIDKEKEFDKVVLVGDYFDSKIYSAQEQIDNFLNIIDFKQSIREDQEVILLIGNHDLHYFPEIGNSEVSGYQIDAAQEIEKVILENREHLQIAYQFGKYLFSHAGVSSVFLDQTFGIGNWIVPDIAKLLNKLFLDNPRTFLFNGEDPSGNDIYQTPVWIRPEALIKANFNRLKDKVIQIFGHTKIQSIKEFINVTKNRYYLIDTLGTSGEYLVIQDGIINTNKLSI